MEKLREMATAHGEQVAESSMQSSPRELRDAYLAGAQAVITLLQEKADAGEYSDCLRTAIRIIGEALSPSRSEGKGGG